MNIEQELKLQLNEYQYRKLTESCGVTAVKQVNYYFTADGLSQDVMVRVRHKADSFVLGYKRRIGTADGVYTSDERESTIPADVAEQIITKGLSLPVAEHLLGVTLPCPVFCVGQLTTWRSKYLLGGMMVEVDKNEYLSITDYELECESNDVAKLNRLKSYLLAHYGVKCTPSLPKSYRFAQRAGQLKENN